MRHLLFFAALTTAQKRSKKCRMVEPLPPIRERHDLGRLDDDRVASNERRNGEKHDLLDGVVPGRADGDDAVGVPHDQRAAVDFGRVRLSYEVAVRAQVDVVVDLRERRMTPSGSGASMA